MLVSSRAGIDDNHHLIINGIAALSVKLHHLTGYRKLLYSSYMQQKKNTTAVIQLALNES